MADQDLLALYSTRILQLAASIPHAGRIEAPHGAGRRRSPVCGSTVAVEVALDEGRVSRFAQEVRACALGQAAAGALGGAVLGRTAPELRAARAALWAMLREGAPAPAAPFDAFKALLPARDHPNRHASIMLALDATLDAVAEAERKKAAMPGGTAAE